MKSEEYVDMIRKQRDRYKQQTEQLKSEQNKVAVEKLEELEQWIMEQPVNDEYGYENNDFDDYISVGDLLEQIKELKGESK